MELSSAGGDLEALVEQSAGFQPWRRARRVLVIDLGRLVFDGDLQGLIERHSPDKILRIQLAEPVAAARLSPFGTLQRHDGLTVELAVPRASVTRKAGEILALLPVADIAIEEPAVEDVIRTVFRTAAAQTRQP
jgi:ABC-2 type transport system ATP-binding protein